MIAKAFLTIEFLIVMGVNSVFTQTSNTSSIFFDYLTTGVVFSPYVKRLEGGVIPTTDQYTLHEIKTMLEVVADKFQMTATCGMGANDEEYVYGVSYNRTRGKVVLCAEAASLVNKERNQNTLTVLIGVARHEMSRRQMNTEIELAFESAQIANGNHPGTVTGIIFTSNDIASNLYFATQTLELISKYKSRARSRGLKVGTRQDCGILTTSDEKHQQYLENTFRWIISQSDFIICTIFPFWQNLTDEWMYDIRNQIVQLRNEVAKVNPWMEFMIETGWPDTGTSGWENIDNLVKYWKYMDRWAHALSIRVWMFEAFDTPWKLRNSQEAHMGWWKIRRNRDAGIKDGYIEKIFANSTDGDGFEEEEKRMRFFWYLGTSIGITVLSLLIGCICSLYWRVNKLQKILSKDDIQEFLYGVGYSVSNETAPLLAKEDGEIEPALMIPYNKKKFEIPKEKIDINHDKILGCGQFGCVFKAIVKAPTGVKTEVALKMPKPGCPTTALKSLLCEIKILVYLGKHTNIVSIVGAYTAELAQGVVYIATEICKMGSLLGILRSAQFSDVGGLTSSRLIIEGENAVWTKGTTVTLRDMLKWAYEIASGMEYLAIKNVVHADLATRNVLLSHDKTAKITDFGLSRRLYDYTNYVKRQQEPLPWRWMAVESLKKLQFSSQSDVWSFGVTLWEIFSLGDHPYPGLNWNLEFVDKLENGLRMMSPKFATAEIFQVMSQCWEGEPENRPTFTVLKGITGDLLNRQVNVN